MPSRMAQGEAAASRHACSNAQLLLLLMANLQPYFADMSAPLPGTVMDHSDIVVLGNTLQECRRC